MTKKKKPFVFLTDREKRENFWLKVIMSIATISFFVSVYVVIQLFKGGV